jgi:glycerophosphoryl diester phosphodiesterase
MNSKTGMAQYDCKIPTLDQWLEAILEGGMTPMIELKGPIRGRRETIYAGMAERVVAAIRRHNCAYSCVLVSFRHEYLFELSKIDRKFTLHALYKFPQLHASSLAKTVRKMGSKSVNCWRDCATKSFCDKVHKLGLKVMVFTADEPEVMRRLIENGVDGTYESTSTIIIKMCSQ